MDACFPSCVATLMHALQGWMSVPAVGLGSLFVVAFLSATLLPLGSEALLLAVVGQHPQWLWPALLLATAGNTLGGAFTWWMGRGAQRIYGRMKAASAHPREHARAHAWLQRFGPAACVLAWLPVVGDPLCAVAGWLRMPFWSCVAWMALGKFARYAAITAALWGWAQAAP